MGKPSDDYPYQFSIYKWLDGRSANHITFNEKTLENIAFQLSTFLKELQGIDYVEGSEPGQHNWWRGGYHINVYNKSTREQIADLTGVINSNDALDLWKKACSSEWRNAPVWIHGDFAVFT